MRPAHQLERIPPHNLEAEQGVLGSMLLDRDAIARTVEILRPDDFYRDAHRVIFTAMIELFERGEPVDLITVTNRLAELGKLDDIGGATYLASLPNVVPTAANVDFYAGIVLEKAMLRSLINAGTRIAALGYEGADDVAALIDEAEKLVFGIASRRNVQDFQSIKEILKASFEKIDKRYQEKGTVTGLPTGFTDFDMLTSGLQPADMIIVAARPSVGKCLTGDCEVVLEDGSICTIEEICRRRKGRLLTLGPGWTLQLTEPSAFVDDGLKPVFRVTTVSGRTVTCTASHPFLTPSGWLPLAALQPGIQVAVPRIIRLFGTNRLPKKNVELLAYLVTREPSGAAHPNLAHECRRVGPRKTQGVRTNAPELPPSIAQACLPGKGSSHGIRQELRGIQVTSLPLVVFTLAKEQLALLLNRIFAASGWTSVDPKTIPHISCPASTERLARQVQHLLLRFGILSSIHKGAAPPGVQGCTTWQVRITDPASLRTFAQEIGIEGQEDQVAAVLASLQARAEPSHTLREPDVSFSLSADASPRRTCVGDVYWDEIASIEPAGIQHVYDLTVPATHNFVANDICVHNTTFAINIAQHVALAHKIPVAIFSLETSKEQLVQRILCAEAQVDNTKLRTGFLADEDWRRLARAMGSLSEAPIFIDDSPTLSVIEMRAKARKLKAECGLGLIVIDYIQMIQSYKRAENRTQELSEIARSIKSLAKELDIPIIAISQLSRAVEALGQKRPMLSHLRESGELEQTADLVVFLYREDYYDPERAQKEGKENICEVIIAKHRNGPIGTVELFFHKEYSRFANLDRRR